MKKLTLSDNYEWSEISDAISSLATALNSIHSSVTCSAQYSNRYIERANWYLKLAIAQLRRAGFSASDFERDFDCDELSDVVGSSEVENVSH